MTTASIYELFTKRDQADHVATTEEYTARPAADGIHPYAQAIRQAWLDRLDRLAAKPWQHGDAWDHNCFVTARKLTELANSPWSGYSHQDAQADYLAHAPRDSMWDQRQKCWDQGSEYSGGTLLPEPEPGTPIPDATTLTREADKHDIGSDEEEAFWSARPLLNHLRTFAQARMTSPWAVLGVTLAKISATTPYTACLPPIIGGKGSINLFIGLVGPSGGGKGAAEGVAHEAITTRHIRTVRIASGEAITHVYKAREKGETIWRDSDHAALISVAEIDRLAGQKSRQGSTIMADLRSAWSGELLGQVAADASRSMPLEAHEYRLALVAGIQPHRADVLLDDADGGTPQRFLWMPVSDPDSPEDLPEAPEPIQWQPPHASPFVGYDGIRISVCERARAEIRQARKSTLRGDGDPLDGHALQCQLKTAAILGIADGRYEVTDEDWRLAGIVQRKSAATRAGAQQALAAKVETSNRARAEADAERASIMEERQEQDAMGRVLRRVMEKVSNADRVSRSDLRRAVASRDRGHFDSAIEQLVDSHQIEVEEVRSEDTGRPSAFIKKL